MSYCDFAGLERAPLERDPFDFVVVPDFLKSENFPAVLSDYPEVPGTTTKSKGSRSSGARSSPAKSQ